MFRPLIKRACSNWMRAFAKAVALLVLILVWLGLPQVCGAQAFQDFFADRQTITAASGALSGNNSNASLEPGEPRAGGKVGGHSLWISWLAPANGVVRFKTET